MKTVLLITGYYIGLIVVSSLTVLALEKAFNMYDDYKIRKASNEQTPIS